MSDNISSSDIHFASVKTTFVSIRGNPFCLGLLKKMKERKKLHFQMSKYLSVTDTGSCTVWNRSPFANAITIDKFTCINNDVIKWKHFPRYWPFVRGIHRPPVNSPHKGQWRGALLFTLICARINGWVNHREAGDLRRHRGHNDVNVMWAPRGTKQTKQTIWHAPDKRISSPQVVDLCFRIHSMWAPNKPGGRS